MKKDYRTKKVIINNGTGLFPLSWIGSGMASRGRLSKLVIAAYPTKAIVENLFCYNYVRKVLGRLLGRKLDINEKLLEISWFSEIFYQLSHFLRGKPAFNWLYEIIEYLSHLCIELSAWKAIRNLDSDTDIYHCRAGFGGLSIQAAQKKGLITLCHHTLAHPLVLDYLVQNRGSKPSISDIDAARNNLSMTWRKVLFDIERADFVLIESDFQLETFKWVGFDLDKIISINHPGIDPHFRSLIPDESNKDFTSKPKILYAGSLNKRKGADELQRLIEITPDIDAEISIAGMIDSASKKDYKALLSNKKVNVLGVLKREELAREMSRSDVLVLLSYAEGSPRSVLEAMGCGCVIFTTQNSGTPVQHLENGWISEPWNLVEIEKNYRHMLSSKQLWDNMKYKNRELALNYFTPEKYFTDLENLYDRISVETELNI